MSEKVEHIFGGPSGEKKPDQDCIAACEKILEMAKSGEIVGVAAAFQGFDNTGGYHLAGFIGSYSMLGVVNIMNAKLLGLHNHD